MENETKINTSNSSKCKNDETEGNSEPESQAIDGSSNFLRRPHKPPYSSLLLPLPSTQDLKKNPFDDIEDKSMAGFTEFRKYKRVNESRKITPYVPEDTSKIQAIQYFQI
ncbi:uncharacterized protein [Parasteatoda tepidariorum]|uniref:uncharacterized protein n=1 Tax=Parasteatoda tepidariorum TaxID=114398 RepID=UPI001C727B0C|nr:uncharacterized protein LOC122270097 [Parasteatoda tepidariorum]